MFGSALSKAVYERVKEFNPYYSGSLTEPSAKDVDNMIIQAAWKIQHPEKNKKTRDKEAKEEITQ